MSLTSAVRDTLSGFKSLLVGMRITAREAAKPIITVQYPHETLKMPDRFRGHLQLILDQETGKARCTACGLCVRACPSDSLQVDGIKREGEKKKSVTEFKLDFTTCSLCGCCVEACPSDAIEYSKVYNVVSDKASDFGHMDLVKKLDDKAKVWAHDHPTPPAPAAPAASAPAAAAAGAVAPLPAEVKPAAPQPAESKPAAVRPSAPAPVAPAPTASTATTAGAQPQGPDSKTT